MRTAVDFSSSNFHREPLFESHPDLSPALFGSLYQFIISCSYILVIFFIIFQSLKNVNNKLMSTLDNVSLPPACSQPDFTIKGKNDSLNKKEEKNFCSYKGFYCLVRSVCWFISFWLK